MKGINKNKILDPFRRTFLLCLEKTNDTKRIFKPKSHTQTPPHQKKKEIHEKIKSIPLNEDTKEEEKKMSIRAKCSSFCLRLWQSLKRNQRRFFFSSLLYPPSHFDKQSVNVTTCFFYLFRLVFLFFKKQKSQQTKKKLSAKQEQLVNLIFLFFLCCSVNNNNNKKVLLYDGKKPFDWDQRRASWDGYLSSRFAWLNNTRLPIYSVFGGFSCFVSMCCWKYQTRKRK